MSELGHLTNLKSFRTKYNLTRFIETGTGYGNAIAVAKEWEFSLILSCDIHEHKVVNARRLYPYATIETRISTDFLENILSNDCITPTFFWLDAHFSADGGLEDLGHNTPILDELKIIAKYKCKNSVVVVDDMRMFDLNAPISEDHKVKNFTMNDLIDIMIYHNCEIVDVENNFSTGFLIFTPHLV